MYIPNLTRFQHSCMVRCEILTCWNDVETCVRNMKGKGHTVAKMRGLV